MDASILKHASQNIPERQVSRQLIDINIRFLLFSVVFCSLAQHVVAMILLVFVLKVSAIFKEYGVGNMTVQIEKEAYYRALNKLSGETFHVVDFPAERTTYSDYEQNVIKSI